MWSWNEVNMDYWGNGTFETKDIAIEEAKKAGLTSFYVGECEIIPLKTNVDTDIILDEIDKIYRDESGCDVYLYENVSSEDVRWLECKLSKLMKEFNERTNVKAIWFKVISKEYIDLK